MNAGGLVQWWTDTRVGPDTIRLGHAFLAQRPWSQCGQWRRGDLEPAAGRTRPRPVRRSCRLCVWRTTGPPSRSVVWRSVDGEQAVHAFAGGDLSLCADHPAGLAGRVAPSEPAVRCGGCRWALIRARVEEMGQAMF